MLLLSSEEDEEYAYIFQALDISRSEWQTREIYREQWQAEKGLELPRSRTDEANAAGVNAEFTQNIGSPGRTICDLARTWGADLIGMGRRALV